VYQIVSDYDEAHFYHYIVAAAFFLHFDAAVHVIRYHLLTGSFCLIFLFFLVGNLLITGQFAESEILHKL